jgi:hypothetical protein
VITVAQAILFIHLSLMGVPVVRTTIHHYYQEKMKEETHSWGIVLTAGWVAAAASTMHQQAETKQRRGQ